MVLFAIFYIFDTKDVILENLPIIHFLRYLIEIYIYYYGQCMLLNFNFLARFLKKKNASEWLKTLDF